MLQMVRTTQPSIKHELLWRTKIQDGPENVASFIYENQDLCGAILDSDLCCKQRKLYNINCVICSLMFK